ncbi:MAG TPA: rRNA maturation RNase YbeY [Fimbriimonadaceae bacterium]|nr:rRNA maturation RNase YbeY [Fimbriimonadaceae bacterium]
MEPPSSHAVAISNESGRRAPRTLIARAVSTTLALHGRSEEAVSVLIGTDEAIRDLNSRYRGQDEATDVLTFPSDDVPGAPLGDIAIALPYAERQARLRGVSLSQELGYLAIHGTLHLLGFDDEEEGERARMVREMNRVAVQAGLKPDEDWASILHAGGAVQGAAR